MGELKTLNEQGGVAYLEPLTLSALFETRGVTVKDDRSYFNPFIEKRLEDSKNIKDFITAIEYSIDKEPAQLDSLVEILNKRTSSIYLHLRGKLSSTIASINHETIKKIFKESFKSFLETKQVDSLVTYSELDK